jgi:hypothetical protein
MMPVSNGESILTAPAGRPQGSAGIHFWFFGVHISSTEDAWLSA